MISSANEKTEGHIDMSICYSYIIFGILILHEACLRLLGDSFMLFVLFVFFFNLSFFFKKIFICFSSCLFSFLLPSTTLLYVLELLLLMFKGNLLNDLSCY